MLSVESKRTAFERRQLQFPPRWPQTCNTNTNFRSFFWVATRKTVQHIWERSESIWEVCSITAQRSHDGNEHETIVWQLASSRMSELQKKKKKQSGCKFGDECAFMHEQVEGQPNKRPKKNGDKRAVAMLQNSQQLGCVFEDIEPPKSSSILRKSTNILRTTRIVQFSNAALRHAKNRESKGLSQCKICQSDPHERSPYEPKFEDRSNEETLKQERCARGDAWR